ncbi:MAG TPA: hypothetical protein VKE70_19015 [Candidatus Solibacter sp.]|nr:hypothetical protein [Candidatus Solibacter sp.]
MKGHVTILAAAPLASSVARTFRTLTLLVLAAALSHAQGVTFGGVVRGGGFYASSGGAAGGVQAGVEGCLLCSGRFGLFAEYSHWFAAERGSGFDRVHSADLAGAGLRIQSRRAKSLFFDVGLAGGRDQHSSGRHGGIGGVVIGTGIGIPVSQHWLIRPQFRAYVLSPHSLEGVELHSVMSGGLGIDYRFR